MPCIKRPQTARCPLQAESERNAGLLINGECAQYGFRGMGLRRISPQRAAQQASLLNCIGIGKITASSAKEFDHIPVIRTQKRFAGHFAGLAFNASNHFTDPVREPPRFTDVRPLANLRESAAALETGITRPAFRHGSAPGEGAPMPSNEEKELPIL